MPARHLMVLTLLLSVPIACSPDDAGTPFAPPGSPLPGLTESEEARFQEGRYWFDHGWTPEEGLGPLYIQDRCSSCHDLPELGGTGVESRQMFSHFDSVRGCDPLLAFGGPVRQERATLLAQATGIFREDLPEGATEVVRMTPPILFGMGLAEAIPEGAILALADPKDEDGDGISGRVHRTPDGRIGRFTAKAEVPTLRDFVEKALASDLSLTSPGHPEEQTVNGRVPPSQTDPVPDPEVDLGIVDAIADFVRLLAPPAPEVPAADAVRDSIAEGERLFGQARCTGCHVPALETGPNPVEALDRKTAPLYSDLLLHDMGPESRGVCAGDATPTEFRTAILMGIRVREPYVAGYSARELDRKIIAHGGEGATARDRYSLMSAEERSLLLRFLRSL